MKALNIENPEAVELARQLAAKTGETITQAVITALRERLRALERSSGSEVLRSRVAAIQAFVASLPEQDQRSAEKVLGYDESGLPT